MLPYLSLSISEDGQNFVNQAHIPNVRTPLVSTFPLSDLNNRGAEFAAGWVGAMNLRLLAVLSPILVKYGARLDPTPEQLAALTKTPINLLGTAPIQTRPAHLRSHVNALPPRLIIRPCGALGTVDLPETALSLAELAISGPQRSAIVIGTELLRQSAFLNPDAFAPFGELIAAFLPLQA